MQPAWRHWHYRNDSGDFVPYSDSHSVFIERIFAAQSIVISGREYRFDFSRMKQVNVVTGYERDIRYYETDYHYNSALWSGVVPAGWKYRNDSSFFVAYSKSDNVRIEHIREESKSRLCICGREYRFHFVRMKQVNAATGFERDIGCAMTDNNVGEKNDREGKSDNNVVFIVLEPWLSEYNMGSTRRLTRIPRKWSEYSVCTTSCCRSVTCKPGNGSVRETVRRR